MIRGIIVHPNPFAATLVRCPQGCMLRSRKLQPRYAWWQNASAAIANFIRPAAFGDYLQAGQTSVIFLTEPADMF